MGFFFKKRNKDAQEQAQDKAALEAGLGKTKQSLLSKLQYAVMGKSVVDDEVLDSIEEALIASDVGVDTTVKIIERLENRVKRDKYLNTEDLNRILCEEIEDLIAGDAVEQEPFDFSKKPYVIMVVGVNGVGKTTTIGKLAAQLREDGKKVVLGAADTFRAAAVDQLVIWAQRAGVDIVKQEMGSDPHPWPMTALNRLWPRMPML